MGFWNSTEQLGRISIWLMVALIIFGILTAMFGASAFS